MNVKTERLEIGGGIKAAFELRMLLKAFRELSVYCSCNKTLLEELGAAEALEPQPKLHLTSRNVLQLWGSLHQPFGEPAPPCCSLAARWRGLRSPFHHYGPLHKAI